MLFGDSLEKEGQVHDTQDQQKKFLIETEDEELVKIALKGENTDQLKNARGKFGHFHRNPILTNGLHGTMIYLGKLSAGKNKKKILFHCLGKFPNSITNKGDIYIYEVVDERFEVWDILFVDMYHPRRSNIAPEGYVFEPYNHNTGDKDSSLGTHQMCSNFPFNLVSVMTEDKNPRYVVVEKILQRGSYSGGKYVASR